MRCQTVAPIVLLALSLAVALAQTSNSFDPPPYVSYYGNTKCSSLVGQAAGSSANVDVVSNYVCDSVQVPSAWQQANKDGVYDLAVVGAGFSGAYLVNRISQEMNNRGLQLPKIALLERTDWAGGRLLVDWDWPSRALTKEARVSLLKSMVVCVSTRMYTP